MMQFANHISEKRLNNNLYFLNDISTFLDYTKVEN